MTVIPDRSESISGMKSQSSFSWELCPRHGRSSVIAIVGHSPWCIGPNAEDGHGHWLDEDEDRAA